MMRRIVESIEKLVKSVTDLEQEVHILDNKFDATDDKIEKDCDIENYLIMPRKKYKKAAI